MASPLYFAAVLGALAPSVVPSAAHHTIEGHLQGGGDELVEVTSIVLVPHDASTTERRVALVRPLPAELDLEVDGGRALLDKKGHLVGLAAHDGQRRVVVRWRASLQRVHELGWLPLALMEGPHANRLVVRGGLELEPDARLGLVRRIGHSRTSAIDRGERRRVDRLLHDVWPSHRTVGAVYFRSDEQTIASAGMVGRLVPAPRLRWGPMAACLIAFVLACCGLLALWRRTARQVRIERAEAYLQQELDDVTARDGFERSPGS